MDAVEAGGVVVPKEDRRWALGHRAIEHGREVDAVERSLRQGLAGERTKRGQQIAGVRDDMARARRFDACRPLDEAGDERAAFIHLALHAAMRPHERSIGGGAVVTAVK